MKKLAWILLALLGLIPAVAEAQTRNTPPERWAVCQLGKAPVYKAPAGQPAAPREAQVFLAVGGPVIMSEDGPGGSIRWIQCRLPKDTPSYRGGDGVARDVESNQPYIPVFWDAAPPAPARPGEPGAPGHDGLSGINCWDINMNRVNDQAEDINGDGRVDVADCQGRPGLNGRNGENGRIAETPTPTPKYDQWGNVGLTAAIGGFSSKPVSSLVGGITGRGVCDLSGLDWDIGAAFRDERRGPFLRLVVAGMSMTPGSYVRYACERCGKDIAIVAKNMRVYGVKAEGVFPFTDNRIQPVLSVHAGVGVVTGTAKKFDWRANGEGWESTVHASELFGNKLFFMGGIGAGAAANISDHFTAVATAGLDWPGVGARVSLTYWP